MTVPIATLLLPVLVSTTLAQGKPPKVVELEPANLARDVDAKKVTKLTVRFDQAMNRGGFSICGGGPKLPKITKRPRWKDDRTLVVEVELLPDHDYVMSLNCPAAQNFRSARGVALVPTPWRFSTLPAVRLSKKEQRKLNEKAFVALQKVIDEA